MGYRHSGNKVYLINYHFVWCPKRRKAVLVGDIRKRLIEVFKDVANELGVDIISLEVMPDHLHLFVSAYPTISPHKIVRRFKGRSSNVLRREFPELLKLPSLWTHSYFVSTAGNVSNETIKKYIEMQSRR